MAKKKSKKGRKGSKHTYRARTYDETNKSANERSGSFDQYIKDAFDTWTPGEGTNRIRILEPTWSKATSIGYPIYLHYGIGPDDQSYLCAKEMLDKPCAVCDERAKITSSADADEIASLAPKKRILLWIIDRKKEQEGIKIWGAPVTLYKEINLQARDEHSHSSLALDNPHKGHDVEFTRTGMGLTTKYAGVKIARSKSPISDDDDDLETIRDFIYANPLPKCLNYYDYDHITEVFAGSFSKDEKSSKKSKDKKGKDKKSRAKKGNKLTKKERKELDDDIPFDGKKKKKKDKNLGDRVAALAKKKRGKKKK